MVARGVRGFGVVLIALVLLCVFGAGKVLAADVATVTSEPTAGVGPTSLLEDDDLSMGFAGAWRTCWTRSASGQTFHLSSRAGSYAVMSFEGTTVALVAGTGPDRGLARIYVDNVATATVDLYASNYQSRAVWSANSLTAGTHTLKVVVVGAKRPASRGVYVAVDAVEYAGSVAGRAVSGTLVNNGNANLVRSGRWFLSQRTAAFGGSSWRAASAGRSVTIRFKGTGIAWIGRKDRLSGSAEVLLDGRRVAVVSQYSQATAERRVVWSMTGLSYGAHNVTIRALGIAGVPGGGAAVDVDAFVVNGSVLKAYQPTPFHYPWRTYIVIDKSSFRLYWIKNGLLIKVYPVAHGKVATPTPSRVWRVDAKYTPDPNGVYGPRKMRLFKQVSTSRGYRYEYTRYGIHGTNEPWVIGTRASHGCIRMYNRDVLELWPQVPLGTMVVTRD